MNFTELLKENKILLTFMRVTYLEVYPDCKLRDIELETFEMESDSTITFYSKEYNGACHCHPEYEQFSFTLPIAIANTLNASIIVANLRAEKERVEWERNERDRIKKERDAAETEAAQRKAYEALKKKFGDAQVVQIQ